MADLKYIGKNILNHDLILKKGDVSGSLASTGSFGHVIVGGKFDVTDVSSSLSSRVTNLKTDSGSFSTRVTNLKADSGSFSTRVTKNEGTGSKILSGQLEFLNITASNNTRIDGNLTVAGNYTVSGQTTFISSSTLIIGDNIIEVNASNPVRYGGMYVRDVNNAQTGSLIWDSTNDYWIAGQSGSEFRIPLQNSTSNLTDNKIVIAQSNGRIESGNITDDGTSVTIPLPITASSDISSSASITGDTVNVKTRVKAIGSSVEFAGNTLDFVDGGSTSRLFRGIAAGAFEAYHAGNKKLETTAGGINVTGNITGSGNLEIDGNISGSGTSTGSFGLMELSGKELNVKGVQRDQVLKFNGTHFVPAAHDATFVFTIADFDMNDSTSPQLIGAGTWKAVGALTFTATYNNGPPDGFNGSAEGAPKIQGFVDGSVSSSYDMFPLSSSFSTGTNPMAIKFPLSSGDDIKFKLFASAGSDVDNDFTDQTITFRNQFVFGESSKNNGFTQSDIAGLAAANTITTSDTTRTISTSIGGSNFLAFAHRTGDTNVTQVYCGNNPNRLTVAMDRTDATTKTPLRETVSYTNTAGFVENFFVYASKEQNIDAHSTTFVTSTNNQIRNYIYWGTGSAWVNNEASVEGLANKNTSYDDGSITGNTLSVGSFTNEFVIVAIPNRYGDNDVNYQLKDNSTNLPFSFNQQSDVTVTNAVGFQEDYSVYRSTNLLTMTNATVLIDTV